MITGLGGGGAEQMVLKLGLEAKKSRVNTLVVPISNINTIEQKFIDAEVPYYFLGITSIFSIFRGLKRLKQKLSSLNGVVLHCHMFHALVIGILFVLFFRKVPIVFTLHNNAVQQKYRAFILRISKGLRNADILFSKTGSQKYLKNTLIIPNGLDIANFQLPKGIREKDLPVEIFHFLFLGSLTEQKNPLSLVDFVTDLNNRGITNFVIDVVGDGPYRSLLETKVIENGYVDSIKLHGFSDKALEFIKTSNCLIMPSFWEGMPVVILEAGASRLPIISTPVGSIPDVVSETHGYLVDLNEFSASMISVIENYAEALDKSNRFYDHVVNNYSIEEVFKKHLKLYNAV